MSEWWQFYSYVSYQLYDTTIKECNWAGKVAQNQNCNIHKSYLSMN